MSARRRATLAVTTLCFVVSGCSNDKDTDAAAPASLWDARRIAGRSVPYPTSLIEVFADGDVVLGTVVDVVPGRYPDPAYLAEGGTEEEFAKTAKAAVVRIDDVIRGSRFRDASEVIATINPPLGADGEPLSLDEMKALATTAGPAIWWLVPLPGAPEASGWYLTTEVFVVEDGHVVTPYDPNFGSSLDLDRFSSLEEFADAIRALPEPTVVPTTTSTTTTLPG